MMCKSIMPAAMLAILFCAACTPPMLVEHPTPPTSETSASKTYPPAAAIETGAAPIPTREIDLAGHCKRTEEDGYREDAMMQVSHNDVKTLNWKLWVSRRGTCEFQLTEFKQTQQTPHIELVALDGSGCKLMVWQDPRRVTLAHARCEKRCTNGVYEQAWPVLFDPDSGNCADIR